jgi:hypothetical protein
MEVTRSSITLLALTLLFASTGASCRQYVRQYTEPRTLPEAATLEQIVEKVNGNTAKIISAQSTQARLKAAGVPGTLVANIAIMSPKRLHLQGSLIVPQLDMGSNDDEFWIWVKNAPQPAVFVCKHEQFAQSNARQFIPIEPERLIETIALPHIDPNLVISAPQIVGANRIEIISRLPTQMGDLKRSMIVDGWNGYVLEQHIYDPLGATVASSITSRHKHDPTTGAAMPRTIEMSWPTAKMSFTLTVTDWTINGISPENAAIWQVPQPKDYPIVDLADPNLQFGNPGAAAPPPQAHMVPRGPQHPPGMLPPRPKQDEMPPLPATAVHPAAQYPAAQYPAAQYPAAQYPAAQHPSADYPAADYPAAGHPEGPANPLR